MYTPVAYRPTFQNTSLLITVILEFKDTKNPDIIKLDGIKAALLAPLNEIPSISNLYSSPGHKADPRKIVTAEVKSNSNEISVCLNVFKYRKII